MTVETEAQLESALVARLQGKGWEPVSLRSEQELWANLRAQLGAQNGTVFSDEEFARIRNHLEKGSVFEKAETLRGRFRLDRDDGSSLHIRFFNSDHWCRNRYQVATQICMEGRRNNRYDVTLLINGLPLCQIELKRRGVELKTAFDQINRYQKDSFSAAGGLFMFVQIFVISNGVNTRYYANNRRQSFKQTFTWSETDNRAINRLEPFADLFLEKCHLSKMIAKYVVLHQGSKSLMVLRPYQYYAAEKILERVQLRQGNGYVWHTTGSGKTLTSFKAAQNLVQLPKVDKVVFVVDRKDLDSQTTNEFNHFEPGSVDGTDNTRQLVKQLTDPTKRLVITTIQKLNTAISRDRWALKLENIGAGRVVFIFDECHRSQFGDAHRRIVDFFPKAQLFGFTGTPIFMENAVDGRTTKSLFGERLHTYVITDAIRDENVLRFSVEYLGDADVEPPDNGDRQKAKRNTAALERIRSARDYLEQPERIAAVVDWIIDNHDRKTRARRFGAMMATGSVRELIAYYEAFRRAREAGRHDLNIATIFTYAANEADPEADGLMPGDGADGEVATSRLASRDALARFVEHYNASFGVNESVMDGDGFARYATAIARRMKSRDADDFDPDKGIDILLVVNMFLTGFDVKRLNTLYVDKNLRYHGLIQAFSRTNRILDAEKSQGNVVCFRDLKESTDEAIALFADRNACELVLIGSYEDKLAAAHAASMDLIAMTSTPDAVDELPHEEAQAEFVRAFRKLMRARHVLASFSEFDPADLPISEQVFEEFKSKYLDMSQRSQGGGADEEASGPLTGIDFELELLRRDEINVSYILALLMALNGAVRDGGADSRKAKAKRKQIFDLLMSEIQLRGKRELIEAFMDERMPGLGPDEDVRAAFRSFWNEKRSAAYVKFVTDNKLDPAAFETLCQNMTFSGIRPRSDDVLKTMLQKPGILKRKRAAEIVLEGIDHLIETFDLGLGDFQDEHDSGQPA